MHSTSCWASVSSRWTWGVMREWSLPRMSSTGKADSRKPRACIRHMHWLLCTQTHTDTYSTPHTWRPRREGPCLGVYRARWKWEMLKAVYSPCGFLSPIHPADKTRRESQCVHPTVVTNACSSFNGKHDEWCDHMSDLGHSQDVLSIGAEVMSALPADPLQSRHAGHRQLCLYKTLEHHG